MAGETGNTRKEAESSFVRRVHRWKLVCPDLGIEYAKAQNLETGANEAVYAHLEKIKIKFANPNFWITGPPDTMEFHESEMGRLKNA